MTEPSAARPASLLTADISTAPFLSFPHSSIIFLHRSVVSPGIELRRESARKTNSPAAPSHPLHVDGPCRGFRAGTALRPPPIADVAHSPSRRCRVRGIEPPPRVSRRPAPRQHRASPLPARGHEAVVWALRTSRPARARVPSLELTLPPNRAAAVALAAAGTVPTRRTLAVHEPCPSLAIRTPSPFAPSGAWSASLLSPSHPMSPRATPPRPAATQTWISRPT